jgi:hypothetical protein
MRHGHLLRLPELSVAYLSRDGHQGRVPVTVVLSDDSTVSSAALFRRARPAIS